MKYLKYFGIGAIILGFLFSMAYYIKTNSRSAITYETSKLSKQTIEEKIVATGSVVPEDEVNIVPQISGIIDEIFVEEGDEVVAGDFQWDQDSGLKRLKWFQMNNHLTVQREE